MPKLIIILATTIFISCNHARYTNPHVLISTFYGDIEVELFPEKAPKTVAAFLSYVDSGYYKNCSFYRVITNENVPPDGNTGLIQGGIFSTNNKKLVEIPGIVHESTKLSGLTHTSGTISLARTTPGTARSEFFIAVGNQTQFDSGGGSGDGLGFAAFGTVVKGMNVVKKIQNSPSLNQFFKTEIRIDNIKRL
jgi:peptidyl-prolyl cis-trans isomerase A (cyclophilin A)